eukprot:5132960-Amphidinium_carterae.1
MATMKSAGELAIRVQSRAGLGAMSGEWASSFVLMIAKALRFRVGSMMLILTTVPNGSTNLLTSSSL